MYTAEDYINFIEMGRFDIVSSTGLDLIAKRFRELEHNEFRGPGEGDYSTYSIEDQEEISLVLVNPGPSKLMLVKTLKEELGISLREGKELVDTAPCVLLAARPLDDEGKRTTDYKHLLEIQLKLDEIQAGTSLK